MNEKARVAEGRKGKSRFNGTAKALKEAKKLDRNARKKIVEYLEERVLASQNPYQFW